MILLWRLVLNGVVLLWLMTQAPFVACSTINGTKLDCGMRVLALRYAKKLQAWRTPDDAVFVDVHDALRLTDFCGIKSSRTSIDNDSRGEVKNDLQKTRRLSSVAQEAFDCSYRHCIFVSPSLDSSINVRNGGSWVTTAHNALLLSRSIGEPSKTAIVFREGTHELKSTLRLGPQDSGLSLEGYPGEEVWISGGISIPKQSVGWKRWSKNPRAWVADLTNLLFNRKLPKVAAVFTTAPHRRLIRARYPNSNPELHQWGYSSPDRLVCSISAQVVTEWHPPPPGQPPKFELVDFATHPPPGVPVKNDSTMTGYNMYASGSGGVCAELWGQEADSYWCSNASAGGWAEVDQECAINGQIQIPAGMTYNLSSEAGRRISGWGPMARGGIIYAWHSQSWSMHMFEIETSDFNGTLQFHEGGGKQGGRNWCRCDQCTYAGGWCGQHQDPPNNNDKRLISGSWLVENVLAELDQPGEFFFDPSTKLLYLIPNVTNPGDWVPEDLRFALHETLVELKNVSNITISHLGFRDSAPTFMSDWSAPSGGDWALHRGGAVFMEHVNDINVRDCTFRRLDGSAVFLSNRTRNVTIERNLFEWLGENAVATWGDTQGYDASDGNFPIGTIVQHNVMRELGIYQKQSSAFGQAKAALSTIRNNLMFNMPRAAINFNDGMGGGDVVRSNLIFNSCRESGDHGPINSWDRQPFLSTLRDGVTKSFDPKTREIVENFIIANYGASEGVDNDDGSSWFHIHKNVFHTADGFKMDYGGHDSVFENNLVFANGRKKCVGVGSFYPGHGHVARGNKCVVGLDSLHVDTDCGDSSCSEDFSVESESREQSEVVAFLEHCRDSNMILANNSYFTATAAAVFTCGDDSESRGDDDGHSLQEMQQKFRLELGSTCRETPSEDTMIRWAEELLF